MKKTEIIGAMALAAALLVGCGSSQSGPSSAASSAPQSQASSAAETVSSTAATMQEIQPNLESYSVLFLEDKDQEPGSSYFKAVLTSEEKEALAALLPADQWQLLVEPLEVGLINYFSLGQDNTSQELRVCRMDDHTALICMRQADGVSSCWYVPAEQQALEEFAQQVIQRAN